MTTVDLYKCPYCGGEACDLDCGRCGGAGELADEGYRQCPECAGDGIIEGEFECLECGKVYNVADVYAAQGESAK